MPISLGFGVSPGFDSGNAVTVIGGGGAPENGFGSSGYFLNGDEVAQTAFFSSAYDSQYHTAEGIVVPDEVNYSPQLASELVALLEQPFTVVLDGEIIASGVTSQFRLMVDEAVYFEVGFDESSFYYSDNTDYIGSVDMGIGEPLAIGRWRVALTKTDGAASISVNGGAVFNRDADSLPYSITTAILTVKNGASVSEFTIMAPQDDADLSALSALT